MLKPIKVHPVESASIVLWGDDRDKEYILIKARNCVASVISFDKRQIWEVYPYKEHSGDAGYCGACWRKGMYIRLMPDDFKRIFGKENEELCAREIIIIALTVSTMNGYGKVQYLGETDADMRGKEE